LLPSPGPETGADGVAAGLVGASEVLPKNPADARKIAANNTNAMEFASSVLVSALAAR